MVYRVYSSWIKEFNGDQVSMLNDKYSTAPHYAPEGRKH